MKVRRYLLYSIAYTIAVWALTQMFANSDFTMKIFGFSITLPVSIWTIIPVILLALLSLFHISYHRFKDFLYKRATKRDLELYNTLAKEIYLGLESNKEFKTDLFVSPSEVTKSLSVWGDLGEPKLASKELYEAYEISKKIRNGEVCDLKKFRLLKTNHLFLQNEKNKIKNNYKYAIELLSSKNEVNEGIYKEAYNAILQNATYAEILKFNFSYSSEDIFRLVNRNSNEVDFKISSSELFEILIKKELKSEEYIKIAIILKTKLDPDKLISIFDKLRNEYSNATEAYLYVLYDLQMLDKLRDCLVSVESGEFDKIETLLFLRENGKKPSIDMFYK